MTPIKELRESLAYIGLSGFDAERAQLSSALDELEHARISVMALAGHRRVIDTLEADNTALRLRLGAAVEALETALTYLGGNGPLVHRLRAVLEKENAHE